MSGTDSYIPGGYVLFARKLFYGEMMDKPPLYFKLWAWMLDRANWKDRDKLKRGQLVATIGDMQAATSYHEGFRKNTPTPDKIRSAYEFFVKAAMITTTKTTRGLIITICNYDRYQNPRNYEAHNEARTEAQAKPSIVPDDTEEGCKKGKKEKTILSSRDVEEHTDDVAFFLTKKKRKLTGKRLDWFNLFWNVFDYKAGKAEAADSWLDIPVMTDSLVQRIVGAAKQEAMRRPDLHASGKTPKMAQGWLSGRRWEDEIPAVSTSDTEAQATTFSPVTADEAEKIRQRFAQYDN
ncbi:hypothetical protein [Geomonas anaerohicana]|uniref:Replication protein n=1 Tax=Geomonas anaerohicana TaxID=2798583 RepID=A0ABS0YGF2_9BACT|nr:hypothetical protein [Geomonas anaerohicana]MBJ6751353.1 hypothetical protein [Geomonas anaerohicana]